MSVKTFAAIDIGSFEVSMKIYEVSAKNGMREIDHIRHSIDMGTETYATGKLGYERVEELCRVLQEYQGMMQGYQAEEYKAYATSAIREAENNIVLLDQVRNRTGIKVEVLSNSAQRFLHYKAIAWKEEAFTNIIQKGTAIVDIGGGSIQISLFDKDTLVSTQNMRLGVLRLQDRLKHLDVLPDRYESLLNEIVDSQMEVYKRLYLRDRDIDNVIIVDDYISKIVLRRKGSALGHGYAEKALVDDYLEVFRTRHEAELGKMLDVPAESMKLLLISSILLKNIMETMGAGHIWAPGVTLCDGIAYEYADKNKIIKPKHDFEQDIFACARNISKRYRGSKRRSEALELIAVTVFDSMRKVHGLGKRERLLLRLAALLHDCGKFISMVSPGECSYSIIMATEIIGLSHVEREIVANVVKYNYANFNYYGDIGQNHETDKFTYLTVAKLTAILRMASGMDRSHKQKFKEIRAVLKDDRLILTVDTAEDITLEKGLFDLRAAFFEEVYNVRPVIRRKRAY